MVAVTTEATSILTMRVVVMQEKRVLGLQVPVAG
jgi:hypothetical protein